MRHPFLHVTLVLGIILTLLFARGWWLAQDRSLSRLQKNGTIRIGYAVEAPFAELTSAGKVSGVFPEVARHVSAKLNLHHIEWCQTEFGSLITGLETGRFDVIAAGIFITPERAGSIRFSEPVCQAARGLLLRRNHFPAIRSYEQTLAFRDIRIAVLFGTVEEALFRRIGLPENRLVRVPDMVAGQMALESGTVDGLALSAPALRALVLKAPQLAETTIHAMTPSEAPKAPLWQAAFAFRRDEIQLSAAWNKELKQLIAGPHYRTLLMKFGLEESELPGPLTVAQILSRQ